MGWHLDLLLRHFCVFFLFSVTFRYGVSGAHWDSGNAWGNGCWGRPCGSSPGCFLPIGILLRPRIPGPLVTFRRIGRFGPATRVCGLRSKFHFPEFRAERCTVQILHFLISGFESVACQGCVHAERDSGRPQSSQAVGTKRRRSDKAMIYLSIVFD